MIKDCDPAFFLPDVKNVRKIAYAVSMGNSDFATLNELEQQKYKNWIMDYDYISVREEKTEDKINRLLENEKTYFCAVDPTLLHRKEDYDLIASKRIVSGEYIFLYNIWNPEDGFEMAKTVSEMLELPVYTIMTWNNLRMFVTITKNGIKTKVFKTAPEHFLSLIRNATFVMTDSFHGTAFSIIFEKPFVCINYRVNNNLKNDIRIYNILNIFGLENRYISKKMIDCLNLSEPLDYETITRNRMQIADKSIHWLLNAIESNL